MAMSNNLVGGINMVAILLSIPVLATGIWLATQPAEGCVELIQWPMIILGVIMFLVTLAGFVGAFWRVSWLLLVYLATMLLLLLLLACLVIFAFAVTMMGRGHVVPGRMYMEYDINDFSAWMKHRVMGSHRWERIASCLSSTSVCADMNTTYTSAQEFFLSPISPLQSGCCKPPTRCGYTYMSPTRWISPINVAADGDCGRWSNDPKQLCYKCNSCKAGLLANLRKEWRRADVILVVALLFLIVVYVMGCVAFRNAKTEDIFRRYKQQGRQPSYFHR